MLRFSQISAVYKLPVAAVHNFALTVASAVNEIWHILSTVEHFWWKVNFLPYNIKRRQFPIVTLLYIQQIMECTERCVTVSEPMSPIIVAMKYRKLGDSPEIRQLARDIIRWECRPYPTMQPPPLGYSVKLTSICIVAVPMFR